MVIPGVAVPLSPELILPLGAGSTPDAAAEQAANEAATGGFTYPQGIADLALFLASDRSANTTGTNFTIAGVLITTT